VGIILDRFVALRSPRVAVKDCRWRTASGMVFSFQSWAGGPPFLLPDSWLVTFFFTASLYLFCFFFVFVAIRFVSIRVDCGFWPELGWLSRDSDSSSVFQHRRAHNCLARLTVCNWSLAASSSYQLTNQPTWLTKTRSSARSVNLHFGCFLGSTALFARFFN